MALAFRHLLDVVEQRLFLSGCCSGISRSSFHGPGRGGQEDRLLDRKFGFVISFQFHSIQFRDLTGTGGESFCGQLFVDVFGQSH